MNFVFNIQTPNYFGPPVFSSESGDLAEHGTKKRRLEKSVASFSTKKPRHSKVTGKSFQRSSKLSKLNTVASLSKIDRYKPDYLKSDAPKIKDSNVAGLKDAASTNKSLEDLLGQKHKVSFNSEIEVFPAGKKDKPLKAGQKTFVSHNLHKFQSKKKKVTSSLFSKNPDIPQLQMHDVKPPEEKSFSSVKPPDETSFSSQSFRELNLSSRLVSTVEKFGFSSMTLVQQRGIPVILNGNDALIKSETGSGKTLAYVLPIIHMLMCKEPKIDRKQGLFALITVPTRELAVQTYQWLEKLCKSCISLVPGYLIGGENKHSEKSRLRKGINIIVATPGRLLDHITSTNSLNLAKVQYFVLDEADRMLDMGYEKSIMKIVHSWKDERKDNPKQTILLSATLTSAVLKLADISLDNPKVIDVSNDGTSDVLMDEKLVLPKNLSHFFMIVPQKLRLVSLAAFIIQKCKFTAEKKMLVFMATQDMVDYHTAIFAHILCRLGKKKSLSALEEKGNQVLSEMSDKLDDLEENLEQEEDKDMCFMKLHGRMTQEERTAVFKSFHQADSGVLMCTDVASRGLDLPQVNWIIQYNPASQVSDYVHRVGRTARANLAGSAVVFVSPAESNYVSMLSSEGIVFNEIMVQEVLTTLTRPSLYNRNVEKVPGSMEVGASRLQDSFENCLETDEEMKNMAVQGYVSFVRSYAAIPKIMREYLCFQLLHLGHCAKSFGLRDPPGVLGIKGTKAYKKNDGTDGDSKKRKRPEKTENRLFFAPRKEVSEFDAGF